MVALDLFLKGMMGALALFSYLVLYKYHENLVYHYALKSCWYFNSPRFSLRVSQRL
jgi:hypothetical protein